jgi:hypothetical protein
MNSGLSLLLRGHGDGTFEPVPFEKSGLIVPQDAKSLGATDLNGDGRVDFVVGVNNDQLQFFENRTTSGKTSQVALRSSKGDHQVVGARVTLTLDDRSQQTAEVYCGEGYLTQTPSTIIFGLGDRLATDVHIRWPDGQHVSQSIDSTRDQQVLIER